MDLNICPEISSYFTFQSIIVWIFEAKRTGIGLPVVFIMDIDKYTPSRSDPSFAMKLSILAHLRKQAYISYMHRVTDKLCVASPKALVVQHPSC